MRLAAIKPGEKMSDDLLEVRDEEVMPTTEEDSDADNMDIETEQNDDDASDEIEAGDEVTEDEDTSDENNDISDEDEDHSQKNHQKVSGVQKRIDRLTAEKKRLEEELEQYRRLASENQESPQAADISPPNFEDYDNWKDYAQAQKRYEAELYKQQEVSQQRQQFQQYQARQQQLQSTYEQRAEDARNKYDDYDDCEEFVGNELGKVGPRGMYPQTVQEQTALAIANALKLSDNGADLVYFLGKNKAEFNNLIQSDPASALMKIGALSAKFESNKRVKSNASQPIKRSKGTSSNASVSNMSYEDFLRTCK